MVREKPSASEASQLMSHPRAPHLLASLADSSLAILLIDFAPVAAHENLHAGYVR